MPRADDKPEDGEARFLRKRGEFGNGFLYFHNSKSIKVMGEYQARGVYWVQTAPQETAGSRNFPIHGAM
jgi:hypothetical protein